VSKDVYVDATSADAVTLILSMLRILNSRDKLDIPDVLLEDRARNLVVALAGLGIHFQPGTGTSIRWEEGLRQARPTR